MSIKTNTKDFTSVGSRKQIGKRNSGVETTSPKAELKALGEQKKQLKAALKGLEKQETQIKKQITKSKSATKNKKKVVNKKQVK